MADNPKPTRTLSDIRPPSQAAPTVVAKKPAEPKPAAPDTEPVAVTEPVAEVPAEPKPAKAKKSRNILKVATTAGIILALLLAVGALYFWIFQAA